MDERQPSYTAQKLIKIINVCTALYNICIHYKIHLDPNDVAEDEDDEENITNLKYVGLHIWSFFLYLTYIFCRYLGTFDYATEQFDNKIGLQRLKSNYT